jgi:arylsulfatase A-like enzyme
MMGPATPLMLTTVLLSSAAAASGDAVVPQSSPPKCIFTVLIDDLGSYDTAVNNPDIAWLTPNLRKLSHEGGLQLSRFYVNKYCSPTRRAFLSGRFPVSVSMMQAQPCDNTLPLEATLLSQKLKQAPTPWSNHFIGKGHLGYPTTDHLPVNRGFDTHVGYLMGAENYEYGFNEGRKDSHDCPKAMHGQCVYDMWHDTHTGESIHEDIFYSTNYYTSRAINILLNHTKTAPSQPLWVHLMYQGVHSPYSESPVWEQIENNSQSNLFWDPHPFGDMLRAVDTGIGNLTSGINSVSGLWEETLLIISAHCPRP